MRDFQFDPETTPFDPAARGFHAHNALLCAAASNLAYEKEDIIRPVVRDWGYTEFQWIQGKKHDIDTQGYVCAGSKAVLLVFRGTDNARDWLTNLQFDTVPGPAAKVHRGFWQALVEGPRESPAPMSQVRGALARMGSRGQALWVTGHSLGGALAVLCAAQLALMDRIPVQGIYTFGQPRAGAYGFAGAFDKAFEARAFRLVNHNDIVPMVPPVGPVFRYWHTEREVYIDEDQRLHGSMPLWRRLTLNARGRFQDPAEIAVESIADHAMDGYVGALRSAIARGEASIT